MHIRTEHKAWHYILHCTLAILAFLFLVFSDSFLFEKTIYGSNVVFGDSTSESKNKVVKSLEFEDKILKKVKIDHFFADDSFSVQEDSSLELNFSDFSLARADSQTDISITKASGKPSIHFKKGTLWASSKEHMKVSVDQAMIEIFGGATEVTKNEEGVFFVTAWEKPLKLSFFSEEKELLWEFLLPSEHQIRFSPSLYFSAKEFEKLSLIKLQKEFEIQKIEKSKFANSNLIKDLQWKSKINRAIGKRKNSHFNVVEIKASLLEFSPNVSGRETVKAKRESIIHIWDALFKGNFTALKQKLRNIPEEEQITFMKYAGFYLDDPIAVKIYMQTFPNEASATWKEFWELETLLIQNGGDENKNISQAIYDIMNDTDVYTLEQIEYLTLALFKNYPANVNIPLIHLLNDVSESILAKETSKEGILTRKLETIQNIFSITDNLVSQKQFTIARKMLDNMDIENLLDEEVLSSFAAAQEKIISQKNYKRGEIEYAEILGDEEKKDFNEYLVIKERLLEKDPLHAAADESEFSRNKTIDFLSENNITTNYVEQNTQKINLFTLNNAKNEHGVKFSGTFNAKSGNISKIKIHYKNGTDINAMYDYSLSVHEIGDITEEKIERLINTTTAKEDDDEELEINIDIRKKVIPSEIIDFVSRISQKDFIEADIMVGVEDLKVASITQVEIKEATPHFLALREEKRKEQEFLKKSFFTRNLQKEVQVFESKYHEYTINFLYDVETKKAWNVTAFYTYQNSIDKNTHEIILPDEYSLYEMVSKIDSEIDAIKGVYIKEAKIYEQLQLAGFNIREAEISMISNHLWDIQNVKHHSTGVEIVGKYNPDVEQFVTLSFLNIEQSPVHIKELTSLTALQDELTTNRIQLIEKVKKQASE